MITNNGKAEFLRFVAGMVGQFGSGVALGIGNAAVTANDTRLDCETVRVPVGIRFVDYVNSQVIVKVTLPDSLAGTFYEVGLTEDYVFPRRRLVDGSSEEVWSSGQIVPTNARIGGTTLEISASPSGTQTATISQDFAIGEDSVVINYFVGSNVSSAFLRLRTSDTSYYQTALTTSAGYHSLSVPLSSFNETSSPNKNELTSILVSVTATSGGTGRIFLDSIDLVAPSLGGDLLARQVLPSPVTKLAGREMDIELPIDITL